MPGMSVATLHDPEFLNINSINPLVSKCEIKVLYVGENRNRSFISKEVAIEMAQTLPGCPIVGYYIENKEDFGDHGEQIIIDGEGVKFKKLTKPYGFVAPDSKIWFQEFQDTDEFGNTTIREYLMTEGYLWTGQYEECQRVIDNGNPQSMELDEKTLKGHWSTNTNKGVEFFIINDAMFSKLCILGEDVEPCFEGASVTAPDVSSKFSKDDSFIPSLFSMIEQLKTTLQEGGYIMDGQTTQAVEETVVTEEVKDTEFQVIEGATEEAAEVEETVVEENFSEIKDNVIETVMDENQDTIEEFKKAEEKDEKSEEKEEDKKTSEDEDEETFKCRKDDKEKYSLLEEELSELKNQYALLETEVQELRSFKAEVEDAQKDEMINSFCMLSDEDKADVIENKSKYSLDEIEAKLSVICVRKKVSFDLDSDNKEETAPTTFSLDSLDADAGLPEWLKAVEKTKNAQN